MHFLLRIMSLLPLIATAPATASEPPLRAMIGQMIMVGFVGASPGHPWFRQLAGQVARGSVGGVLYLRRNVASRASVTAMNTALRQAAGARPAPLACVDQEGGAVQRLRARDGFAELPAARDVAAAHSPAEAETLYARLATDLRDWGFNCNLGPVVDVDVDAASPAIGRLGRSYSRDPAVVSQYAAAFVRSHRDRGLATALKHFPGHGAAAQDSHDAFADVTHVWTREELRPYRSLVESGAGMMIMTGHISNRVLDPSATPASLSRAMVTGLLRGELGWRGVVITDDLQMSPVERRYGAVRAALEAVRAGNDLLLFANDEEPDLELPQTIAAALEEEARRDPALAARIGEAHERILALKQEIALRARNGE